MIRVAAALLAFASSAALAAPPPAPAPKLVVAISVDQYSADLFAEYRGVYTQGMKTLAQGVVFPSGYQSHAATETCPGHSTILTGSRPARTGIIANDWYDPRAPRADKTVYCAEDESQPNTDSSHYVVSPLHLRVPTMGDRMKRANPADRVVSVAGKDRAAVMMGGRETDQMWYWDADKAAYVTFADRVSRPVPAVVTRVNARVAADYAQGGAAPALPAACAGRWQAVPVGKKTVGTLGPRKPKTANGWRVSPLFDAATADVAIGLVDEMKLGRGAGTDLLAIGLSATDYVGHNFGTEGAEMCTQMVVLDATIARIVAALAKTGVPFVVMLTADHGGHDLPERNDQRAMPDADRVKASLALKDINAAMRTTLGIDADVLASGGPAGDVYLTGGLPTPDRARIVAALRSYWRGNPQVEEVFTAEELRRVQPSDLPIDLWPLSQRAAASFDPERSGDFLVILKPRITPILDPKGYVATHGSAWNYDRRVPILFWWPGADGFEQPLPVETVDIMPTLAALIGLTVPANEIDGRCLDLGRGGRATCPVPPHGRD